MVRRKPGELVGLLPLGSSNLPLSARTPTPFIACTTQCLEEVKRMADGRIGVMDGFRFGLGFFAAGLVFYIIVLLITVAVLGSMYAGMGMGGVHW